jgi:uncharacterized membrane protein YphA (DoxX/SURF4 family)
MYSPIEKVDEGCIRSFMLMLTALVMFVAMLLTGLLFVIGLLPQVIAFGLIYLLQPFILRFWLWRVSCLPWNMIAFLDEAASRLLLRKVGKRYIFIHRLLLDYFASLEEKEP